MQDQPKGNTREDARRQVAEANKAELDNCKAEIETILNKYHCKIDASMLIKAGAITPIIEITKKTGDPA